MIPPFCVPWWEENGYTPTDVIYLLQKLLNKLIHLRKIIRVVRQERTERKMKMKQSGKKNGNMGILDANIGEARARMYALYGEYHRITGGQYDKSLTYMYFVRKPVTTSYLGAIHAAEIPYLFDTPSVDPMGSGEIVSTEDCEFRHVVKEMWTNFARTGNPSTGKYAWKKFSGDDRQTMVFGDTIGMQKDIFGRREDLMMSWAERLGNGSSKRVC